MYVLHKYVRKKWDTFSRHGLDSIKIHIYFSIRGTQYGQGRFELSWKLYDRQVRPGFTVGSYLMYNFKWLISIWLLLLSLCPYLFLRSLPLCGASRASSFQKKVTSGKKKVITTDSTLILVIEPRMKDGDLRRKQRLSCCSFWWPKKCRYLSF